MRYDMNSLMFLHNKEENQLKRILIFPLFILNAGKGK